MLCYFCIFSASLSRSVFIPLSWTTISLIGHNLSLLHKYAFERVLISSIQLHLFYGLCFSIFEKKNHKNAGTHLRISFFPSCLLSFLHFFLFSFFPSFFPVFLPSLLLFFSIKKWPSTDKVEETVLKYEPSEEEEKGKTKGSFGLIVLHFWTFPLQWVSLLSW